MAIKILTKNSIEVTNVDDARLNNFNAGLRSGIIKGAFNEGSFFELSSNSLVLETCELLISGHRIIIDEPQTFSFSNKPSTTTRYALIAEIVSTNGDPSFRLLIQPAATNLIKENLFKYTNGSGTYQLEIGRFTLTTAGTVTDIVRTADIIISGWVGDATLNIGKITTNTLDAGMEAEVDVEQRFDKQTNQYVTDFTFSIPSGKNGENGKDGQDSDSPVINNNIVENATFEIDQQNRTSYSANGSEVEICDRWILGGYGGFYRNNSSANEKRLMGSSSGYAYLAQNLSYFNTNNRNKPVTLTVKIDGVIYTKTGNTGSCTIYGSNFVADITNKNFGTSYRGKQLTISTMGSSQFVIEFVKVEAANESTAMVKNSPDEDLLICQKYYLPATLNGVPAIAEEIDGATYLKFAVPTKLPIAATPTLTWVTTGTIIGNGSSVQLPSATPIIVKENDSVIVKVPTSNITPNNVYIINDTKIVIKADITQ